MNNNKQTDKTPTAYLTQLLLPMKESMEQIFQAPILKTVTASILFVVFQFLADHLASFIVLTVLVLLDQASGMIAAHVKKTFTSARFRAGLLKILVYAILVTAFHLLGTLHPLLETIKLDHFAILYLSTTEAFSISENVQQITGFTLPKWVLELIKTLGKKGDNK
jgi:phage-related holin